MEHQISILTGEGQQLTVEKFKEMGFTFNDAAGVILQTPIIGVVISLDCFEEQWGETGKLITKEKGDSQNLMDLSGFELTKQIVDFQQKSGFEDMSAAKRCWGYHSKTNAGTDCLQWYLPCAYELCTICAFKEEIKAAMISIGVDDEGMLQFEDWFWSSSEGSSHYAVSVYFDSGHLYNTGKHTTNYVRAISAFKPL